MEVKILKDIFVHPRYPQSLTKLHELSYNLWCTWNYDAIKLFYHIDSGLFREVNNNPVRFLYSLPKEKVEELSHDKGFLFELDQVWDRFQDYLKYEDVPGIELAGQTHYTNNVIAYFAMEFGLHECIPIYGGGLGVLSGDFLKAASDFGLPVVGVGLIYKLGYFTQRINVTGEQEELFIEFDNHLIPIRELRSPSGETAYFKMKVFDSDLWIKLWQIDVGKTRLVLLDTDLEDNPPDLRAITHKLYTADREKRLQQELVLGFGGVRALEILGIEPIIYHINEGHSAFLIVARLLRLMTEKKLSFSKAKALIRSSTVFTTHTPVNAGNENFKIDSVKKHLEKQVGSLIVSLDKLVAEGLIDNNEYDFSLPAFAIRFSKYINAVSKIHRDVSRKMWTNIFPNRQLSEIPIDYVTNGVHRSWLSEPVTELLNEYVGPDYIHRSNNDTHWNKVLEIADDEIWQAHHKNKQNLISFIRNKLRDDLTARGHAEPKIVKLSRPFNPEFLTIVFARRFAYYKRATLILKDKERLQRILKNDKKPVQLIFAGKAHPADTAGKNMIKEIIDFTRRYELQDRILFLEDYDINIAKHLVWGADVWLNTPMIENEASGTSGMKAAINGVLNFSVMDGWWPEAYNGQNGWAITAGEFYKQSQLREIAEAEQIYDLLEDHVTELYYDRNELGIPEGWIKMMKESIYSVCGNFNMNRVLSDYFTKLYKPAIDDYSRLSENNFQHLTEAVSHEDDIIKHWAGIHFTDLSTNLDKKDHISEAETAEVNCTVDFGPASPKLFAVELFYTFDNKNNFELIPMQEKDKDRSWVSYQCSFEIAGYGVQSMNCRLRPSNEVLWDLHPELIKWA
jgi:starch phosphorylase